MILMDANTLRHARSYGMSYAIPYRKAEEATVYLYSKPRKERAVFDISVYFRKIKYGASPEQAYEETKRMSKSEAKAYIEKTQIAVGSVRDIGTREEIKLAKIGGEPGKLGGEPGRLGVLAMVAAAVFVLWYFLLGRRG